MQKYIPQLTDEAVEEFFEAALFPGNGEDHLPGLFVYLRAHGEGLGGGGNGHMGQGRELG